MRLSSNSLLSTALIAQLSLAPAFAAAQPAIVAKSRTAPEVVNNPSRLPVTRVSLYKNGVGFFEHSGHVTGDQSVTIDFTTAQLNDVLQSLTAIDLNGGRISGAGYNSTTPLNEQLKGLPLGLSEDPTAADFYNAIRGARVEITGSGAPISGRLLSLEVRNGNASSDDSKPAPEKRVVTVVSESGDVRSLDLTPTTQVRLLDTNLHTDVNRYLELLDTNRNQGLRHLTLEDRGSGSRDLHVSYISEVPVWKSTYRILFTDPATPSQSKQTATLQGWSVVDNTTGADWNNVQLSLIAGAPQSFIQPLSTPYYTRRPQIPLPTEAQLTPQTHESGDEPAPAPLIAHGTAMSNGSGSGIGAGLAGNVGAGVRRMMSQNASVTVEASPNAIPINGRDLDALSSDDRERIFETAAAKSLSANTTTSAFDDFFEYKLTDPITIRKNESALVPILQAKIDAQRVTLWSPQQPVALRALWITNTSNLTLDRGSFSIVENGNFGGEGLLDPIHPAERRLLSYAADQAVRVTPVNNHGTRRVERISVNKGVLSETSAEASELEYAVRNAAPEARTVVIEHPVRAGWQLDSATKPSETTSTVYRFSVEAKPGETSHLHVGEHHTLYQTYRLVNTGEDQLTLILHNDKASPALLTQLEPVFAAKRRLTDLGNQIKAKQAAIDTIVKDQDRLRANLSALKGSAEERELAKRYTGELNQQEDQLATMRKDLDSLKQQHDTAQQDLTNKIESLHIDETI